MANNITELIVKVGKKSSLSFSHSKAYRAITADELIVTANKLNNCNIIIIEDINDNEYDSIRDFLVNYKNDTNYVWFYSKEEDYNDIQGLADELEYDVFFTKDTLFRDIFNKTGLNLTTDILLRKEINSANTHGVDEFDSGFDNTFGTLTDEDKLEDINDNSSNIENTSEINDNNTEQLEDNTKVENKVTISINKLQKDTKVEIDDIAIKEEYNDSTNNIDIELVDLEIDMGLEESTVTNDAVDKLLSDLENERKRNKELTDTISLAENRLNELSKLNKALRDKYNAMKETYDSIVESDNVIEDPISLTEYNELKEIISQGNEHRDKLEYTIKELTEQSQSDKNTIIELQEEINSYKDKLQNKNNEISLLNDQIKNGELSSSELKQAQITIKTLNDEITKLKGDIEILNITVNGQLGDISKLRIKIDEKNDIINVESLSRQTIVEFSNNLVSRLLKLNNELTEANIKNTKHQELIAKLQKSGSGNAEIIEGQTIEITKLRKELSESEKKIKEAVSNIEHEKKVTERKLTELQSEFDNQSKELEMLESQYEVLKSTCIFDEDGANALIETNNTLETINESLRKQLQSVQSDLEKIKTDKQISDNTNKMLEEQNAKLRNNLKSMTASGIGGYTGGQAPSTVRPIKYNGKAVLIPVFGCGSYGITTTAVSIARRLSMNARVAFIDLDLMTAKADIWFRRNPMCNVRDFMQGDLKFTAMGLFLENGMNYFSANCRDIIHTIDGNRNGGLDYISGIYNKLDTGKLARADFSSLLNFLGGMYQYIVIDLGKLGCSDINDNLIKNFTDVAYRSVVVTTSDKLDIRNFRIKLDSSQINVSKIAWLLNLCTHTGLDEKTKIFLSPARYMVMPFNPHYYGSKEPLINADKQLRDTLNTFMNEILFS